MVEISGEPGKSVLVIKTVGLVTAGDIFERMPELKKLIDETQPKGLLGDWTQFQGWDEEAESLRFSVRLDLRHDFERIAILADEDWDSEISRLQEVTNLPIRRFASSDRQAALAWLDPDTA